MKQPIKILIADDHVVVRNGIKLMLQQQNLFTPEISEARNGNEAIEIIDKKKIDVLLLDLSMPELDGIAVLCELNKRKSNVRSIVFTMHNEEYFVSQSIQYGAYGFISKQSNVDELTKAIKDVMDGVFYFSEEIESIAKKYTNEKSFMDVMLTTREREIMILVGQELTNHEIADKLKISKRTVEGHRKRLSDKLNVKTTVGLIKYAVKNGII